MPLHSQVHVDAVLSNMSVRYMQDSKLFAASRFLPKVAVKKQSDKYYKHDKGDWFRDDAQERAPGAPAAEIDWTISTATYTARRFSAKYKLPDEIAENADDPLNLEEGGVSILSQKLNIKRERRFASTFMTTSVWATDNTGVASGPGANQFVCWNVAGSNPREYLRGRATAIQKSIGMRPNKLVLGQEAWDALAIHPDFADLIATDQTKIVSPQLVAQALDIEEIIVAGAAYNTAAKGQTASMSFIIGETALLAYVEPNAAINKPSAGYQFSWSKFDGIDPNGAAIKKWYDNDTESTHMVGDIYVDMKVVATDCGEFFTNIIN